MIDQLVQIKMFDLPADYLQIYRERVNAVTAADIQRVARQYIQPDRAAVVIVGDAAAITGQVKAFAQTVELYDTAGRRKVSGTNGNESAVNAGTPVDISGAWTLQVARPGGQNMPATLTVNQSGATFTGLVKSSIGNLPISNGTVNGNNFDASCGVKR